MTQKVPEVNSSLQFWGKMLFPAILPILIGFGSAVITAQVSAAKFELRIAQLEHRDDKDQVSIEKIMLQIHEQDRRLTHVEAGLKSLDEIKIDVKTLLRSVGDRNREIEKVKAN